MAYYYEGKKGTPAGAKDYILEDNGVIKVNGIEQHESNECWIDKEGKAINAGIDRIFRQVCYCSGFLKELVHVGAGHKPCRYKKFHDVKTNTYYWMAVDCECPKIKETVVG